MMLATTWLKLCYNNWVICQTIHSLEYASLTRLRIFISTCVYEDILKSTNEFAFTHMPICAILGIKSYQKEGEYFDNMPIGQKFNSNTIKKCMGDLLPIIGETSLLILNTAYNKNIYISTIFDSLTIVFLRYSAYYIDRLKGLLVDIKRNEMFNATRCHKALIQSKIQGVLF